MFFCSCLLGWKIDVEVKKATHAIDKLQKDSQESLRQMQVTDDI